MKQVTS